MMEGTKSINMEGTRPLTGPALPNLINAVKTLKSKPLNFAVFEYKNSVKMNIQLLLTTKILMLHIQNNT